MSLQRAGAWLSSALLASSLAFSAMSLSPRTACACTTRQKVPASDMKADLRNLVTAQEMFFSDSARYGSIDELNGLRLWAPNPKVQLVSLTHSDSGFLATVTHAEVPGMRCRIAIGGAALPHGDLYDGEPLCDPPPTAPIDPLYFQLLAAYALFFVAALVIRFARAGHGLPKIGPGTFFAFFLLAVLHPFWSPLRTNRSCLDPMALHVPAVIMMGVVAVWMLVRDSPPPRDPRQPPDATNKSPHSA